MGGSAQEKKGEPTLLQRLCGTDGALYACLSTRLYFRPLAAIPAKSLDILIEEAEKSGNFGPPLDKALFEGAQNPGESARYAGIIQDLASRAAKAMEQERQTALSDGLADRAASLERRIEDQRPMRERAEDILRVAFQFYSEILITAGEEERRDERRTEKRVAEGEEGRIADGEKARREARKLARKGMGRKERRDAKREDRREELAAEARKKARREEKSGLEGEEKEIADLEIERRAAREQERRGE